MRGWKRERQRRQTDRQTDRDRQTERDRDTGRANTHKINLITTQLIY